LVQAISLLGIIAGSWRLVFRDLFAGGPDTKVLRGVKRDGNKEGRSGRKEVKLIWVGQANADLPMPRSLRVSATKTSSSLWKTATLPHHVFLNKAYRTIAVDMTITSSSYV
jgi:hypothetical protein